MIKKILAWVSIILIDIFLYVAIGLTLLSYEGFYNESKGPYWSLRSMTVLEKVAYISYFLLIGLNIILIIYIIYRAYKKWGSSQT